RRHGRDAPGDRQVQDVAVLAAGLIPVEAQQALGVGSDHRAAALDRGHGERAAGRAVAEQVDLHRGARASGDGQAGPAEAAVREPRVAAEVGSLARARDTRIVPGARLRVRPHALYSVAEPGRLDEGVELELAEVRDLGAPRGHGPGHAVGIDAAV